MGQNAPTGEIVAPPAPPAPDPELDRLRTENARQAKALALATARADFPQADVAVLEMFEGSPEGLRGLAEKLHGKELERQAALSHGPGPAPTPGPGGSPSPGDVALARYNELKGKVLGRYAEPQEREEYEKLSFAHGWNQHMSDRKSGTGARA